MLVLHRYFDLGVDFCYFYQQNVFPDDPATFQQSLEFFNPISEIPEIPQILNNQLHQIIQTLFIFT